MYRDDSELIQACLNGDETAWNGLVEHYKRLVYSIPLRKGMSYPDAEDVFQNVFTSVFRQLKNLRDPKLIVAWLIQITYHECQRLRQRSPDHAEIPESFSTSEMPAQDEIEIWENSHLVDVALSQLEPKCRELLMALFIESPTPSYAELSTRLGIPAGSIGPTRARCFKKLQAILIEMGVDFTA